MTNEQINISIAETCGWKDLEIEDFSEYGVPCFILIGSNNTGTRLMPPDYCDNLNDMHEAVIKTFQDASMQLDYSRMLIFVIKKSSPIGKRFFSDFDLANATAKQRAEVFLRTLGKWEDTRDGCG